MLVSDQEEARINCLAALNGGPKLVLGLDNGKILIRDLETSEVISSIDNGQHEIRSLATTEAGSARIFVADGTNVIRIWDPEIPAKPILELTTRSHVSAVAVDGLHGPMVSGDRSGSIRFWPASSD